MRSSGQPPLQSQLEVSMELSDTLFQKTNPNKQTKSASCGAWWIIPVIRSPGKLEQEGHPEVGAVLF